MSEPVLLIERPRPGLAVVTLNRPQAMNALSTELRGAIADAFIAFEAEDEISVVILTGAGRAFCAGLDLREVSGDTNLLKSPNRKDPIAAIHAFRGVVIGAINGAAVTGGFELALACDVLIAGEHARFADTHTRIGVLPGWQLSQRLSRTIGHTRAKHMSLTGQYVGAEQAERWGLVSQVVPADELLPAALAIADQMLASTPAMLRAHKALIDDGYALSLKDGLTVEAERARAHNSTVSNETFAAGSKAVTEHGRASKF